MTVFAAEEGRQQELGSTNDADAVAMTKRVLDSLNEILLDLAHRGVRVTAEFTAVRQYNVGNGAFVPVLQVKASFDKALG